MVRGSPQLNEPDGSLAPGQGRRQQILVVAAVAVAAIVFAVVAVALGGDDGPVETAATSTTSEPTSTGPTTTLRFDAPPPQERDATTSTEAPPTTIEATSTTTTTAPPPPSTTPPPRAQPGPTIRSSAGRHEPMEVALADARARWDALDRSSGYVFRTRIRCFCPAADNEIAVAGDGQVTGQRTVSGDPEPAPPSIDDVFDEIETAIDADADALSVSFDRESGFPVEVSIDPDSRVSDDERGRTVVWLVFRSPPA